MKKIVCIVFAFFLVIQLHAQEDWSWWNDQHGWEPGMPSWRTFLTISPGYLGPNALPVPEVKKGYLTPEKEIEVGTDFHFSKGDNAQNLVAKIYHPFADNKIAVEAYMVVVEHYAMSSEVRDERKARDKDGRGLAVGDLYFSTLIQLVKNKRFPNTLLRMVGKTASGGRLDAARYSDSPGYFFDLSFSKPLQNADNPSVWTPFASAGFYSWQTSDDENLQNDAFMFAGGVDLEKANWLFSNSISGYLGYKNEKDSPVVYTLDVKRQFKNNQIRFQFLQGIQDWEYSTIKLSYIWKWN